MKLHNDKLFLDETDVDNVLMQEVKRTQHILNEDYDKIEDGSLQVNDIELYSVSDKKKNPTAITNAIRKLVEDYLLSLYRAKKRNITINDIYNKVRSLDGNFIPTEPDESGYDWYNKLSKHLNAYESYLRKKVVAIKNDEPYATSNPKVENLIKRYNTPVATQTTIHKPDTYWEDVFDKFFIEKKNLHQVSDSRKADNRQALKVCFTLIGNKPLNKLKKLDCNLLKEKIYQVPRGWNGTLKYGETLTSMLSKTPKISKTTVIEKLRTFKEFLRYCANEDYATGGLADFILIPTNTEGLVRNRFTENELKKIFNPQTYPSGHQVNQQARFWLPLIALFQGVRLNEIASAKVSDVIQYGNVMCFNIAYIEAEDTRRVKTQASKRIIPIHPKLIEMGFLKYVYSVSKQHKEMLFPELTYTPHNGYGGAFSKWFARYLDSIGISSKGKVYHSFRHTFASCCGDGGIVGLYRNRLGGWADRSVADSAYTELEVKTLLNALSKIQYHCIDKELAQLGATYQSSPIIVNGPNRNITGKALRMLHPRTKN